MISSANAVDTSQIKAACQSSDKTLWVESNQVCIPRNPCENPNYEQYCNRKYAKVQTRGTGGTFRMRATSEYMVLVEAYAKGHNISCVPTETIPSDFGQDYVICMGNDVMVFEFDDISNLDVSFWSEELKAEYDMEFATLVCEAFGGGYYKEGHICKGIGETECAQINQIDQKYSGANHTEFYYVNGTQTRWTADGCKMY